MELAGEDLIDALFLTRQRVGRGCRRACMCRACESHSAPMRVVLLDASGNPHPSLCLTNKGIGYKPKPPAREYRRTVRRQPFIDSRLGSRKSIGRLNNKSARVLKDNQFARRRATMMKAEWATIRCSGRTLSPLTCQCRSRVSKLSISAKWGLSLSASTVSLSWIAVGT